MVITVGPFSLNLYTPAMPVLVTALASTPAVVHSTLSIYLLTFAIGQLAWGPLSDAFGRRPVILVCLLFYVAASMAMAMTTGIDWVMVGRLVQGAAAAACTVIARAVVRDRFEGREALILMSWISMLMSILPAIGPLLGGIILDLSDWRGVFLLMAGYGAAALAAMWIWLPETAHYRSLSNLRPATILRNYGGLLAHRRFLGCCGLMAAAFGGGYAMIAALPFVLISQFGVTPTAFGFFVLSHAVGYLIGSSIGTRLASRLREQALISIGLVSLCLSGGIMLLGHFLVGFTPYTIMLPVSVWTFGVAFILPGITTVALRDHPEIAGVASALLGAMQIGGGFLANALMSLLFADYMLALAIVTPLMAGGAVMAMRMVFPAAAK